MREVEFIPSKIYSTQGIVTRVLQWRILKKKIAFTNGVFDILHPGHIYSLSQAAKEGNYLIVGINSDASVKRLKGDSRPVYNQEARALLLASMLIVDAVVVFEEDTPLELIKLIMPDVIVKGGDYKTEEIAGAKEVIANGGKVVINPILAGFSTSDIIRRIRQE